MAHAVTHISAARAWFLFYFLPGFMAVLLGLGPLAAKGPIDLTRYDLASLGHRRVMLGVGGWFLVRTQRAVKRATVASVTGSAQVPFRGDMFLIVIGGSELPVPGNLKFLIEPGRVYRALLGGGPEPRGPRARRRMSGAGAALIPYCRR